MINTCHDCGKPLRTEETYIVPEPTDPVGEYCRTVCVSCAEHYKQPAPDNSIFSIGFAPQIGTSIPVDDILGYCSQVETIKAKQALLLHLQTCLARLLDLQMQKKRYGLLFSLPQPFPHYLFVLAKKVEVDGLPDLTEIVDGTNYEARFCELLCQYKFFPSQQVYRLWKSQQDYIQRKLL